MTGKRNVIIVGSGLAGLNAAAVLAGRGPSILMIDENVAPGGQFLRTAPPGLGTGPGRENNRLRIKGQRLINIVRQQGVEVANCCQVVGLEPDRRLWFEDATGSLHEYRSDVVVLATGAREKFLPFKGWTLPGVISTGAAQILLKSYGVLPGKTIVVAGCGPLPLVVASEMAAKGGRVKAFVDQIPYSAKLAMLKHLPTCLPKMLVGLKGLARLKVSGTRLFQRFKIIEARGGQKLEEVVLGRMDSRGRSRPGSETIMSLDTLAVGHGFVPNIELPQQAGCKLEYRENKGGWFVAVNDDMSTSVECIYAAGEATGLAGAHKSQVEGQLAGLAVARELGLVSDRRYEAESGRLRRIRHREMAFGNFINRISSPLPGLVEEIDDETIICRCEDVSMGDVRQAMDNGFTTVDAVKKATRCGMGNCQARTCGPVLSQILTILAGRRAEDLMPFSVRFPIKPVAIGALAAMDVGWDGAIQQTR